MWQCTYKLSTQNPSLKHFFIFTYRPCAENLTLLILLNTFLLHKKVLLHIDYVKLDCVTYF